MALLLHFSFAVIYPASSSVFLSKSHFYPASSSVFLSKSHLQLCTGKICIVFRSQKSYFIHIVLILVSLIKLCVTQKDVHNLTSGRTFLFVCFCFLCLTCQLCNTHCQLSGWYLIFAWTTTGSFSVHCYWRLVLLPHPLKFRKLNILAC